MEAGFQEITNLIGREVFSNNGIYVGEVEDVQINTIDEAITSIAVSNINPELFEGYDSDARGVLIPYRWVRAVGDIVLVNDIIERIASKKKKKEQK